MLAGFEALGLDAAELLRAADIDDELLADPDRYLPAPLIFGLWNAASERWNRPGLGLHTGANVPFGALDILDYITSSAPTLGGGLRVAARYLAAGTLAVRYEIDEQEDLVRFRMVVQTPHLGVAVHLHDYSLAVIGTRIRRMNGGAIVPLAVERTGPALAPAADYAEIFGVTTSFECEHSALILSRSDWEYPNPRAEPALLSALVPIVERLLARLPEHGGIVDSVRRELVSNLQSTSLGIDLVAKQIGMSVRTLQRRLQDEGQTYAQVVDSVRAQLAQEYLADRTLAVTDVACLLGYSEAPAFHRAFKRWTGETPIAYRKRC
ncbi:MAG: AraC family transcriptional regulator [bacterium]|nr:AraC family transcriptional regulator [bacterium]